MTLGLEEEEKKSFLKEVELKSMEGKGDLYMLK